MSHFEVPILTIDDVYDHPGADRLSILRIRGYEAITNKAEDGSHRYAVGEPVIYVPEGAVVTERDLKQRGYWKDADGMGMLAGSRGDRVKAIKLRGVLSQGLVWKTDRVMPNGDVLISYGDRANPTAGPNAAAKVQVGQDVSPFFGITKYEPPIPSSMSGDVIALYEAAFDFDIENLKKFPDLFAEDEIVTVTEKLHGTFCRISFLPDLEPRDDLFGDGRIVIASKGLGAKGLVFKNTPENREKNLYVRTVLPLLEHFQAACIQNAPGQVVHLMGEVFGRGVQDLAYGVTNPEFAAFEVWIGGEYLAETEKDYAFIGFGVDRVPVLYEGGFNRAVMDEFCSGSTTLGDGANIREGIVISATNTQDVRETGLGVRLRPILKHVSEAYLTRKGGTELQ